MRSAPRRARPWRRSWTTSPARTGSGPAAGSRGWAMLRAVAVCVLVVAITESARAAEPGADVRAAVGKALPLLWKGAEGHVAERTCFACHNQGVPILAITTARGRGFAARDEDLTKQLEFIADFLGRSRDSY